MRHTSLVLRGSVVAVTSALVLAACGGEPKSAVSGNIVTNGSSTVGPLTGAAGELFTEDNPDANVDVAITGTGEGIKLFCNGETDIANASRALKTGADDEDKTEGAACETNGVKYTELRVATDALSIVVNKDNDFVKCLTTDQLKKLWEPAAEKTVTTWNQIDPKFPAEKIDLYGPGTDSGTFDYFTKEIVGVERESRTDYTASEDDNTLVQGVAGSKNAIGYFGYTYFEENEDKLKLVGVDSGNGCVTPSPESAADQSYSPLSRPLFIYVSNKAYAEKKQVKAFVDFYVEHVAEIAEAAKFISLNDDQVKELEDALAGLAG